MASSSCQSDAAVALATVFFCLSETDSWPGGFASLVTAAFISPHSPMACRTQIQQPVLSSKVCWSKLPDELQNVGSYQPASYCAALPIL